MSEIARNIPIPSELSMGLTRELRKLNIAGESILISPRFKPTSIHPTARSLRIKVKYRKEYSETEFFKKYIPQYGYEMDAPVFLGYRVWRVG